MNQARQVFEAIMRSKGHTKFERTSTGKYKHLSLQVRWNYFQLGWEMGQVGIK